MRFAFTACLVLLAGSTTGFCRSSAVAGDSILRADALEQAVRQARDEQKHLLLAFLGEGWSLRCGKFKDNVLSQPVFREFAQSHLVYFPVEARRRPGLTPAETAVLQSWVIHFDIKSYPTLILIGPDGQELLRHGYRDLDAAAYVGLLRAILPDAD